MTGDADKQQTRAGEIRGIIEDIHSRSIDIRAKAFELTASPTPKKEPDDEGKADVAAATLANELSGSLRKIRNILREAHETLSAFN